MKFIQTTVLDLWHILNENHIPVVTADHCCDTMKHLQTDTKRDGIVSCPVSFMQSKIARKNFLERILLNQICSLSGLLRSGKKKNFVMKLWNLFKNYVKRKNLVIAFDIRQQTVRALRWPWSSWKDHAVRRGTVRTPGRLRVHCLVVYNRASFNNLQFYRL